MSRRTRGGALLISEGTAEATALHDRVNASGKYPFKIPTTKEFGPGSYTLAVTDSAPLPNAFAVIVTQQTEQVVVHEIYNVARRSDGDRGAGTALVRWLATELLHQASATRANTEQEKVVVWLGVRTEDMALITKVQSPAGFYFPTTLPNCNISEGVTPLGHTPGFQFYSGYSSVMTRAFMNTPGSKARAVRLDSASYQKFNSTLSGPREVSAVLVGKDVLTIVPETEINRPHQNGACFTDMYPSAVVGTQAPPGSQVVIGHSHPILCHRMTGFLAGFPSTYDYNAYIEQSRTADAGIAFAREGAFVYQFHPFFKFFIQIPGVRDKIQERVSADFTAHTAAIQAKRVGTTPRRKELASALTTRQLTPQEEMEIITQDPQAAQELVIDMAAFLLPRWAIPGPLGAFRIPIMWLQLVPRNAPDTPVLFPDSPLNDDL